LAVLGAGLGLFYALGLHRYVGFEQLKEHRHALTLWVAEAPVQAALAFTVLYAVVVALSVPGGAFLTVTGGFLFGLGLGTVYSVIGAMIGATGVFLACRTALGDALRRRAGPFLRRMEAGFRENALSYLLVLRLVPIFPFWLVNLVPAFLGVSLRNFVTGTIVGIIPGTFVFTSVGSGLGAVLDMGMTPDLSILFKPDVIVPILGLAALALVPVFYKRWRALRRPPV
jgi:uncharacterized membrane protein YdjX (TVP38/TMEM64 family)